jgi:hypothetical protein
LVAFFQRGEWLLGREKSLMGRLRSRLLGVALVIAMVTTAAPAVAGAGDQSTVPNLDEELELSVPIVVGPAVAQPLSPSVSASFGRNGKSRVEIRSERADAVSNGGLDRPQFSVGLGWYTYLYLDRGDWLFLAGLGHTAATAALCAWLARTIGGAVACAVAAYVVGYHVLNWSTPPNGTCRESKFDYAGNSRGTKLVRRSC